MERRAGRVAARAYLSQADLPVPDLAAFIEAMSALLLDA